MVHVHDALQGSDEWHQLRADKYTGSNAVKLLKYGTIGYARADGASGSFKGTYHTKRGHILEDEAIELYERINHVTVQRPGFVTNDAYPDCGYSPDGIDGEVLLEVKCFNAKGHGAIYNGDIPVAVLAQIHFGLLICGLSRAKLIIYNPDIADPRQAFKAIPVKHNKNISANFQRILTKGVTHA